MAVLGIDVGGHSIKAGIVSKKGNILAKEVLLTEADKGRKTVVNNILKIITSLLKKDKTIKSIGIGIPGTINRKGYVNYTPNIPLSNFDLGKELKKTLKKKLTFGNDADNFALAHQKLGSGKGYQNMICLTLGTGVGSGLIINGELFTNNGAPELGHTTIKYDGPESKCCGNDGCIESFIGRKTFPEGPLEIYKKAVTKDSKAIERFEDYGKHLGIAISNFINIFNPDLVILGGQLSNAYNFFKNSMEKEVKKRTLFKTKIVKSNMREPGIVGAATLAF
jgi:glucokinase